MEWTTKEEGGFIVKSNCGLVIEQIFQKLAAWGVFSKSYVCTAIFLVQKHVITNDREG